MSADSSPFQTVCELSDVLSQLIGLGDRPRIRSSAYHDSVYAACGHLLEVLSFACGDPRIPISDCFVDFGPEPITGEGAVQLAPEFLKVLDELITRSRGSGAEFPFAAVGVRALTLGLLLKDR